MAVPAIPSLDIADEQLGHRFGAGEHRARSLEVEVHRHVVVGVDAGGDHDVEVGGRRDAGDPRDVAAEPDHGEVDEGVHATRFEFVEPRDGVGLAAGFVAPDRGIVLHHLGGQHEDVLMHERDAEIGCIDRSPCGIHLGHTAMLGRSWVSLRRNRYMSGESVQSRAATLVPAPG